MNDKKENSYELHFKQKHYRDGVRLSLSNFNTAPREKKFERKIDENGVGWKVNKITGESRLYTREEYDSFEKASKARTINMFRDVVLMNDFDWFVTVTFDSSVVQRDDIEEVTALYKKWIDSLRYKSADLGYLGVPEPHKQDKELEDYYEFDEMKKCIHYHMLVKNISWKDLGLIDSGYVCCSWAFSNKKIVPKNVFESTKEKYFNKETQQYPCITDGLTVYNVTTFPFGWATATKVASKERCAWYVRKYMDKAFGTTEVFKKRFYYSRNLNLPECFDSVVGRGFEKPLDLSADELRNSDLFRYADYVNYFADYNILSCFVQNDVFKDLSRTRLDNGLLDCDINNLPFQENNNED